LVGKNGGNFETFRLSYGLIKPVIYEDGLLEIFRKLRISINFILNRKALNMITELWSGL